MPFPAHLLTDVCVISRYLGISNDAFATPLYGPKTEENCAFQESFQKIRDSDGNERVSAHSIATETRVALQDRVWLPISIGKKPDSSDDNNAKTPISIRNDRSRSSGFRFYQTFF
jgi:hypothetical protein